MKKTVLAITALAVALAASCGGKDAKEKTTLPPIISDDGFEMILVDGGTFMMGCTPEQGGDCNDDEKPAREVTVRNFCIRRCGFSVGAFPRTR